MSQSGFIAACLLTMFVVWLAANNKLTTYRTILWDSASNSNGPTQKNTVVNLGPFGTIYKAADTVGQIASVASLA